MPPKPKKNAKLKRSPADLPADLAGLSTASLDDLTRDASLEEVTVTGGALPGPRVSGLSARFVVFEGVSLAGAEIHSARLRDCRFVRCDLSNSQWWGFEAVRVEFVDCRLTGMAAVECRWQDVLLEGCEARYLRLYEARLARCEVRNSNLREADLRGADLEAAIFEKVDLRQADVSRARLKDADLRGAEIEGLVLTPEDARGAIVNPAQAMDLARLLGVVIR